MATHCKTEKEFGESIKNGVDEIYIEGDLKNHVLRIRGVGKVAWGACAVALAAVIGTTIVAIVTAPVPPAEAAAAPAAAVSALAAAPVLATTLGATAVPAVMIGVAAGGIGGLVALREKYEIVEEDDKHIKLKKK